MPTKAEEVARIIDAAAIPGRRAEAVIRAFEGDKAVGARLFAPSYREHKSWQAPGKPKAFRAKQLFPDLVKTVEDAFEAGDRVVVRWRVQGTHKGKLGRLAPKLAPTGNRVNFTGISIYRFAGGRIVESWGQADVATLASQCRQIGPQIFEFLAVQRAPATTRPPVRTPARPATRTATRPG